MDKSSKRFDDYMDVDCNECERYWDNSCDGVPVGSQRVCTTFLATRKIVIPAQIKDLQIRFERLRGLVRVLAWITVAQIIKDLIIIVS